MFGKLVLVFVLAIVSEALYTCFAYFVARGDTLVAPLAAAGLGVLKAMLVIQYVRDPVTIAALALGQGAGTYLTLRVLKRRAE